MSPSVVVTEEILPVSARIIERIRRWEFVTLLFCWRVRTGETLQPPQVDAHPLQPRLPRLQGRLHLPSETLPLGFKPTPTSKQFCCQLQPPQRKKLLVWLLTSIWSYRSRGVPVIGLWPWFQRVAAAKNIRVWGELNLHIYRGCLSRHAPSPAGLNVASPASLTPSGTRAIASSPTASTFTSAQSVEGLTRESSALQGSGVAANWTGLVYHRIHQPVHIYALYSGAGLLQACTLPSLNHSHCVAN